jgi:hypothetical protein
MPPVAVPVKRVGIPIGASLHFQRLSLFDSLQGYGMSFLIDAAEISSRRDPPVFWEHETQRRERYRDKIEISNFFPIVLPSSGEVM